MPRGRALAALVVGGLLFVMFVGLECPRFRGHLSAGVCRAYPEEFRREAVALLKSSGGTVREIARDLGVSE